MALRASLQSYATQASVCRRPSFRALSRFTRPVQLRSVHAMAATGNQKLDKSTSEADWKKLLSAEEVRSERPWSSGVLFSLFRGMHLDSCVFVAVSRYPAERN